MTVPVLIIGAGPGGSTTAMRLAGHGVETLLVDKARFPRDKVCGDALSGKVMRTLERLDPEAAALLRADARQLPSHGVIFTAPNGRSLRLPFGTEELEGAPAVGAIMPRMDLDAFLLERARAKPGITIMEGATAQAFHREGDGWRVELMAANGENTIVRCRLLVLADGANSRFARQVAGLALRPAQHSAGVRAYFTGVQDLDPTGYIELLFLRDLLPGYFWIFPLPGGRANVGLGVRSDVVRKRRLNLKRELPRLIGEHPLLRARFGEARMEGGIQGMGLPLAGAPHRISGPGYLLVGDAAHLIDPFTGEGIGHAMISGMHAADVIAAMEGPAPAVKDIGEYDRRVWARLGGEFRTSRALQRLSRHGWLLDRVIGRAAGSPTLAHTITRMFNDVDLRSELRSPTFYFNVLLGR